MPDNHILTVIIPALNERVYLPELLKALDQQTRKADEVIVADAGSTDGTVEIAKNFGARTIPGGMPADGRNAGARAAKGDILLFLDADVVPPPDFIARLLAEFDKNDYDVATCFVAALDENPIDRVICEGTNIYFRLTRPVSPHAPGFCIMAKRAKHEEMGGFDETLFLSEDIDYARRASKAGKFGLITNTRIPVSMRRVGKEGLLGLGLKYAWCEMLAFTGRPVRKTPFRYEFGQFTDDQLTRRSFINLNQLQPQINSLGKPFRTVGDKIRRQFEL